MLNSRRYLITPALLLVIAVMFVACGGQAEPEATAVQLEVLQEEAKDQTTTDEDAVGDETEQPKAEANQDDEQITEETTITNAVFVVDQSISNDTVTVAGVTSDVAGWLVIHAQADGKPGPILGKSAVKAGENSDVIVEIDPTSVTEILYAMLHVDAGSAGEFDFPGGDDVPATDAAGNVVTPSFTVEIAASKFINFLLADDQKLGSFLTDAKGMTLYTFANDVPGTSNCYDRCAIAWPPLLVEEGDELVADDGISGEFGTTEREDGTLMVTYNDWPLYYWVNDEKPGDTTGHKVGNVWAVAYPDVDVFLGGNEALGSFLVGPNGMTLYRFNPDEVGLSNCTDQCAINWPPLLIDEGELPRGNAGVVGELGTTVRDDGSFQVTYQGMPLYYWVNDQAPGDATGHGVNDVWFVMPPYSIAAGQNEELGEFLISQNGMTLYLFTNDEPGASNCTGQCAANWPPFIVQAGEVPVPGYGVSGDLAVIERDDGDFQVTFNGQPLYFWVNDSKPGDTTGHGVNDVWYVVPAASGEEEIDY